MEQSSRNFSFPQAIRRFSALFASPSRYFTENSRWVPLIMAGVGGCNYRRFECACGCMKLNFLLLSVNCIEKNFEIGSVFMGKGYVHASHSCYAIYTSRNRVAKWKPSEGGRTAQKPLYIKEIISYIRRFLTNERYSWEASKPVKVRKRFAMSTELCVFL